RSAKAKPLHATLARRALLRLDSMAASDPHSLGVPRPQFSRLCPACLPRYPLQTILRQVLVFCVSCVTHTRQERVLRSQHVCSETCQRVSPAEKAFYALIPATET